MNQALIFTLLILLFLTTLAHAQGDPKNDYARSQMGKMGSSPDSIDVFLKSRMKNSGIPGLQLAVIRKGKIVKLAHYGIANIQDSIPANDETSFSINSMTKAFVGVAVMQLAEEGKLDLDAPVSQYLDSLPMEWRPATIRQLLTHTSGLPNIMGVNNDKMIREGEENAAWKELLTLPMQFKPGERFSYCQTNYLLIGKIIDKLCQEPFIKFIQDRQLNVAGMPVTRFGDGHEVWPHNARGYTFNHIIDGQFHRTDKLGNVFEEFPPFLRTAAGMYSTAGELARWVIALQQGRLLKKGSSIDLLWTPGLLNNGSQAGFSRFMNGYALGWPAVTRPEHRALAPIGGGRSALFVYPDDSLAIVVLTNLQGANPEILMDEIAGYYIPEMHAYNGFGLGPSVKKLNTELRKRGFENALATVEELKKGDTSFHYLESNVNIWGYALLEHNENKAALAMFKVNASMFPESWNAYDSYGEALLKTGDEANAIKMYRKSVALNPGNENGRKVLERLLKNGG